MRHLFCALLLLAALRPAAAQAPQQPWFFAVLSDPQFGMYAKDANFQQETANFEFVIANLNRLHPRFVVICGDLVNKPGDTAEIAEYKRILGELAPSIPVYNVAGNHDVGNIPTVESLAAYRAAIGPDYYTFTAGNLFGIVLDSNLIRSPETDPAAAEQQQEWLNKKLSKAQTNPDQQLVVFQHIPYFLHDAGEPDDYFNITEPARRKYLDLLEHAGVQYIFAGHYHRNAGGTDGALTEVVTGAAGMPLGGSLSGFRIVTVTGRKLNATWYSLGEIPNQIKLP